MPRADLLETFDNPFADRDYEVHMTCDEFTSLCPLGGIESDAAELDLLKGGAPDFGTIHITYTPGAKCLELKSLKLYLWSFRDRAVFAEALAAEIAGEVMHSAKPHRVTVTLTQRPRGGIEVQAIAELSGS